MDPTFGYQAHMRTQDRKAQEAMRRALVPESETVTTTAPPTISASYEMEWPRFSISGVPPARSPKTNSVRQIFGDAVRRHGVTKAEIVGRGKSRTIVKARWEVAYRMRRELGKSYPEIGRALNRDHTTIQYAIRRYQESG